MLVAGWVFFGTTDRARGAFNEVLLDDVGEYQNIIFKQLLLFLEKFLLALGGGL